MRFRYFFLLILVVFQQIATAQSFSYVYIQGDKQTPFYVKMEDEMQPRYGKNYCIISQLSAGIIHIEVLFQQNTYPSQKFTIKVPDNGFRGFLLTHKGNAFSLYDLQQQFYLPAGNKEEDDHMPDASAAKDVAETTNAQAEQKQDITPSQAKTEPVKKQNNSPQFINDIELNSAKSIQTQTAADTVQESATITHDTSAPISNTPPATTSVINSDCPKPMGSSAFEDLYNKLQKRSDRSKLKFLLDNLDRCYTTNQIRILTKNLTEDPDKFEFLKQAYHRVTDQSNYSILENLLSTPEWKEQFRQSFK